MIADKIGVSSGQLSRTFLWVLQRTYKTPKLKPLGLSISVLTLCFLGIYVTPLFAVYNIRNKTHLRLIFFFKVFQILYRFCKQGTNFRKNFQFGDNCIWIGCVKHSLLLREYLSLGVNMITNSLQISYTTKTEVFEVIFFQSDWNIEEKYCHAGSRSV